MRLSSVLLFVAASSACAVEGCLVIPLDQVTITEGTLAGPAAQDTDREWMGDRALLPQVTIDGTGDAAVSAVISDHKLAVKAAAGPLTGTVWLPDADQRALHAVRFSAVIPALSADAEAEFAIVNNGHLRELLALHHPGAAWFRHQLAAGGGKLDERQEWQRDDEIERLYDLFSGDRAMAENLQLERGLPVLAAVAGDPVDFDSLPGITIAPFDWTKLIAGLPVVADPLAAAVPADQHLILFPSFAVLTATIAGGDATAAGLLRGLATVSEDARTAERYQRQLCLEPSLLSKTLGGQVIDAVAITGGDASLSLGSDVAVLFHSSQPQVLMALLAARQQAVAGEPGMTKVSGTLDKIGGTVDHLVWQGIVAPDHRRRAYLADLGGGRVVVTNSLAQLRRLGETVAGVTPAVGSTPEFRFFRHRYAAKDGALAVLTDATIRRWCSARWRIGEARRLQALAALSEMQAINLTTLPAQIAAVADSPGLLGACVIDHDGVRSSIYGGLGFLTPVAELDLGKATAAEAAAYARFKEAYERRWNGWFDPIGAELTIAGPQVSVDISVLPLIGGSEYNELMRFTMGGKLAPTAGDPHAGTLAHLVVAIDRKSEQFGQAQGFLSMSDPKFGQDPLSWLDGSIALYADADPYWDELVKAPKPNDFVEHNLARLPLGLHLGVGDGLRLAVFLTAIHAYVDRSAPGMVLWENEDIAGTTCVRLSSARPGNGELDGLKVYLLPGKDGLLVSASRDLIARAIARQKAGKEVDAPPWLGEQAALRLTAGLKPLLAKFGEMNESPDVLRLRSWANLTILNEWHRLFPGEDPVAVHERLWHTRLLCPGGGSYVWNATIKSMESTVYGCPQAPKAGGTQWSPGDGWSAADFGLTFEQGGVRARAVLVRDTP